jgi:hypothetical protein
MSKPTHEEIMRGLSEEERDYLVILLRYPTAIIPNHVVTSLCKAGLYRTPLGVSMAKCFEREE